MTDDQQHEVETPEPPRPPRGLGTYGKRLWETCVNDQAEQGAELDPRELAILEEACRTRDLIHDLSKAIKEHGVTAKGVRGQVRMSSLVPELRQQRLALAKLLGDLHLIDEPEGAAQSSSSRRASHAANVRWGNFGQPATQAGLFDGAAT